MEIVGTRRILFVCILAMANTVAICNPTWNYGFPTNNETTDPCKDFYDHVCSRWQREHPGTSMVNLVRKKKELELKLLVEEWSMKNETTFNEVERKLSKYYESCLNDALATNHHSSTNHNILTNIVSDNGHWPINLPNNEWPIDNRNLTLQTIHENYADIVDNAALFDIGVTLMPAYKTRELTNYPAIMLAKFPGGRRDRYRHRAIVDTARIFIDQSMPRANDSDVEREVTELMAFEESLFELEELTDSASTFKISQIQDSWDRKIPQHSPFWINWTEVIGRAFVNANVSVNDNDWIVIEPNGFLDKLADLLNNHTERTVVNYIHWSAMIQLAPYLSSRMELTINGFVNLDKYNRCIRNGPMNDHGMSYLYVKKYFNDFERTRTVMISIIEDIKAELKRKISQSWIDDDAKSQIHDVIDNAVTKIGYPIWYDDPEKIREYMSDLKVGKYYLKNVIDYTRFRKKKQRRESMKPLDRHRWDSQPLAFNAIWDWLDESLTLPVVMLQKPFFDVDNPRVGSLIEWIIGHELGHVIKHYVYGFDNCASTLNTTESCKKMNCFIDQYNTYRVEKSPRTTDPIDGVATFSENFGDNISMKLAWAVYPDKQTNPQRFFKSIAESICEAPYARQINKSHPPMKVRVNGMMKNMREFSTAFDCPVGSQMNPRVKCDFWG